MLLCLTGKHFILVVRVSLMLMVEYLHCLKKRIQTHMRQGDRQGHVSYYQKLTRKGGELLRDIESCIV